MYTAHRCLVEAKKKKELVFFLSFGTPLDYSKKKKKREEEGSKHNAFNGNNNNSKEKLFRKTI